MPVHPAVQLALLALLAQLPSLRGQQSGFRLAPKLPPAANLAHLAKSPSSALLQSDFFALERQRELGQSAPRLAGAASALGAAQASPAPSGSRARQSLALDGQFRLDQYHPLEEIYAFVDALGRRYKHVHVFTIGHTAENRPIKAVELINNRTDPDFVWLDALTHAREWITGSTMLYMLDQLVAGGQQEGSARAAVHAKNYIIVPVVNPDGYAFTWTSNRMWRKNRSRSPDTKCIGADLNRNFDHSFAGEGASTDPCSHIYAGQFAFSEAETKALGDLLWSLKERVKFYLTIHSYNQLWACPYAHTTQPSASLAKHMRVLRAIQRAVYDTEGVQYEIGPLSTSLYVGSGFGIDFAYDKCNIEHSYLVELRDKGLNGFLLPADQILPTARETFAGLSAGLKVVFGGH